MAEVYAYTPVIWSPLAATVVVAAIGLFALRHGNVPASKPLVACSLFASLMLLAIALQITAVAPATKVNWYKLQFLTKMLTVIAGTCFALEYAFPGRWLTRRNLSLLSIPPLVTVLLILIGGSQLLWRGLQLAPDGSVMPSYAVLGVIMVALGWCLVLVNAAAFGWLFIRSPRHRWAVALLLCAQLAGRGLFLLDAAHLPAPMMFDLTVLAVLAPTAGYTIALFGFRIFDPLPFARQTVIEQMHAGVVVFDTHWQVVSLNPAAEGILGVHDNRARGKTWQQLAHPERTRSARSDGTANPRDLADDSEMMFGSGLDARHYVVALSPLEDFRGLILGQLLILRDVTEERRVQARILEQQRSLAMLRERERLARELHDSTGQVFAFINAQGQTVRRLLARGEIAAADEYMVRLVEVAREADTDIRESILGLRVALSEQGLLAALKLYLQRYEKNYGIRTELAWPETLGDGSFEPLVEVQLLRILQEALTNARKHSNADCVRVAFTVQDGCAQVSVQDDGRGFDPRELADGVLHGLGLRVMRERAVEVGGSLTVHSEPGSGTELLVQVPMNG